jgi:uncharacterized protein YceK
MSRLLVLFAVAGGLSGCASSPLSQTPASGVAPAANRYATPIPGLPQSQYECVTDEGYGRSLPCGTMN